MKIITSIFLINLNIYILEIDFTQSQRKDDDIYINYCIYLCEVTLLTIYLFNIFSKPLVQLLELECAHLFSF